MTSKPQLLCQEKGHPSRAPRKPDFFKANEFQWWEISALRGSRGFCTLEPKLKELEMSSQRLMGPGKRSSQYKQLALQTSGSMLVFRRVVSGNAILEGNSQMGDCSSSTLIIHQVLLKTHHENGPKKNAIATPLWSSFLTFSSSTT